MKFSENWLRELVDIPVDRDALMHRLTMAGLEVEGVEALGGTLAGVVVGEIVACTPHPNADKLRVCEVAAGGSAPLVIVCGAPNARTGLKAPLATIGTTMPNGMEIKRAALRGVESNGMLCSAKELGIDADASGLMELPAGAPVGTPLAQYLGLPDASIEIKLTPNRPDCLSVLGLARDASALFGSALHEPAGAPVAAVVDRTRAATLDAGVDCPRYCGRLIEGIDASAKTPLWMAERLRRSGVRPVSALVDVTQYVMLELGQPMHAYDDTKLDGPISVRRARAGERVKLLDGSEPALDDAFLVIADRTGLHGLAGIMGSHDSRVTDATTTVFLEAAHFAPGAIMGRARRLGLHTDASHRFERGVDPELPRRAIERATALILEIAGGRPGPVTETVIAADLPARAPVALRRTRLARLLGIDIADTEVERILRALGMQVEATAEGWRATPPSHRFDIQIEEDLIEEVVRVHGYERVPTRAPRGELLGPSLPETRLEASRLRAQLVARDYAEAICYAFVPHELLRTWQLDEGAVALANPLSADLGVMRTSLLPGLVTALAANRRRQQPRVRLFEFGRVFSGGTAADPTPVEHDRIAGVACGRAVAENWASEARAVDFFDVKGDAESLFALTNAAGAFSFTPGGPAWLHPGQAAEVRRDGAVVGWIGALHPDLLARLDLDEDVFAFEFDVAAVSQRALPRAEAVSRYPSVRRDLSFELPEAVPYAAVEAAIRDAVGETLTQVVLFDRYAGPNLGHDVKSLAIGLILQDRSRTLTDQDADRCTALAVAALESVCKAKLRG
ncbi:phenylalanine--tRNA ligase subunit beta [Dokdonella fugitiva]|uniref:phenylalanine--tRNA ligase subunit beta n=1 Tax=Dokdonella fugitiva TaxID=328517 RepID=UPI0015F78D0E|nr:phenylalanine--tRNA ligase subunit beta [Dokdonella fugitiva]MBA8884049.1 phenylalanyl-tRNA synthetase beta chain [Dokdonella fugitiva]